MAYITALTKNRQEWTPQYIKTLDGETCIAKPCDVGGDWIVEGEGCWGFIFFAWFHGYWNFE